MYSVLGPHIVFFSVHEKENDVRPNRPGWQENSRGLLFFCHVLQIDHFNEKNMMYLSKEKFKKIIFFQFGSFKAAKDPF